VAARSTSRTFAVLVAFSMALLVGERAEAQAPPHSSPPQTAPPGDVTAGTNPENVQATQDARQHFRAGMEHYQARRFREAIQAFALAAELVPSADLWFNIARSHEQLNEPALAAEYYQRYLRDRVDPPDREQIQAQITALLERAEADRAARRSRPTTGTLRVEASVAGSEVRVDDRSVGRSPIALPMSLTPGAHRVAVLREGYVPFRSEVQIEAGVPTSAYADQVRETAYRAIRGTRIWTWVVGGLAVVSLGAGIGVGIVASGKQSDGDLSGARNTATISDLLVAGSLVLAVAATLLYFVEGRAVGTERVVDGQPVAAPPPAASAPSASVPRPVAF
jgi:PEGA domain